MKDVKLIGLMPVFNEACLLRSALENNLKLVDEMIISEGPFAIEHATPENDKTKEVIEEYKSHPKVSAVLDNSTGPSAGVERAKTLTRMLHAAKYNAVDNWAILCAADCFYSDAAINEIRNEISRQDSFLFRLRVLTFAVDFRHYYGIGAGIPLLFRISEDMRIGPIENPIFKDNTLYRMHKATRTILHSCPMFHYTWLKPFSYLMDKFYSTISDESHPSMKGKRWLKDFYLSYEDSTATEYYAAMKKGFGGERFYFRGGTRLKIYEGPHPAELDDHPFRHIDVRTVKDNFDKRLRP